MNTRQVHRSYSHGKRAPVQGLTSPALCLGTGGLTLCPRAPGGGKSSWRAAPSCARADTLTHCQSTRGPVRSSSRLERRAARTFLRLEVGLPGGQSPTRRSAFPQLSAHSEIGPGPLGGQPAPGLLKQLGSGRFYRGLQQVTPGLAFGTRVLPTAAFLPWGHEGLPPQLQSSIRAPEPPGAGRDQGSRAVKHLSTRPGRQGPPGSHGSRLRGAGAHTGPDRWQH